MSHPSNPYGPPQPQPAQLVHPAQAAQPYPYPAPGQVWSQPVMPPYGAPPRQRNGLAIAAIAISVVSLLASLGVVGFIAVSSAAGPSWVLQGQGLVAVCHGSVDGFDWTGLVVFEDESGTFTVNQL